jgi:DNA-binding FadR family transcriptional regulator
MHAAEVAATRADAHQVRKLRAALTALDEARDAQALSSGLIAFLQQLMAAAGNPLLFALAAFLSRIQVDLAMQLSGGSFPSWRKTVQKLARERERVVAAIEAGDAPAARDAAGDYHDRAIKVITALPRGDAVQVDDPLLASVIASSQSSASRK